MSIISDFHLHTHHSGDCVAPMEDMIRSAIARNLKQICITEHNDFGFPYETYNDLQKDCFLLSIPDYHNELIGLRDKYKTSIEVLFGIEIGLQTFVCKENENLINSFPFDFVIASSHLCQGMDPYYNGFFDTFTVQEGIAIYFNEIIENLAYFENFDTYGHLDYIARYIPDGCPSYNYLDYMDQIDNILKILISKGKSLECNTGGMRKPFGQTNPVSGILKRYHELGGELVTIGSDAHRPEDIGADFDIARQLLLDAGFQHYTTYKSREAIFHKL